MSVIISVISISEQHQNFSCIIRSPCIWVLKEFIPYTDATGDL